MSNTTTKTKSAGTSSSSAGGKSSRHNNINKGISTNNNPKNNPKSKKQQQQQQSKKSAPTNAKTKPKPKTKQLAIDPPLECPQSDFDALLGDASGLTDIQEATAELLDCARYGEVDACRAILDVWASKTNTTNNQTKEIDQQQSIVDARDASQSTSLHKACANGHASTVQLLLSRGASHFPNDNGNTPLHWAAGAGHATCVKMLLDHYDALSAASAAAESTNSKNSKPKPTKPLDVLLKNNFGRSSLTEGFASGDTKTVEHLLNHDSAEEEKLIGGMDKKEVEDENVAEDVAAGGAKGGDGEKKEEKKSIVHEFDFLRGNEESEIASDKDSERPSVLIRELPIAHADNPFGQKPIEDTTGLGIWCASLVMSRWLASPSMVGQMQNKTILELGAGCGIPALTCAIYGTPASVTITDLNPETIDNLRYNIELNADKNKRWNNDKNDDVKTTTTIITGSSIDWGDESTYPTHKKLDYVICSDCIYQKDIVPLLKKVVTGLLHPNHGTFLYVAPEGGRDGLPEFIAAMKTEGFTCTKEEIAPESYRGNPLKNGDEEDCFLHFHELASTVYVLYEFRRC
mmetsp:Transcript_33755/g.57346  ORF Transcript_33755/g.57346 Transcript_33755/m.57346 type:complete len:574 (+) Transcript_33755:202-1923(+)|eukprot:CAMPEP_0183729768 /NCGR_PEP_ID=MMETSP0737-20130205/31153_1 /TAXON_ID=385413 /ORGANISM="Thalassiosira miniscula, Strain CCMP1093" /LENGTH=573 /DNA_ID=CAMNT_0025962049 /DNA_START=115 /DNA_END=1836 /DNA_ORIENTATION=-